MIFYCRTKCIFQVLPLGNLHAKYGHYLWSFYTSKVHPVVYQSQALGHIPIQLSNYHRKNSCPDSSRNHTLLPPAVVRVHLKWTNIEWCWKNIKSSFKCTSWVFLHSSEVQTVLDHRLVLNILICNTLPCIFLHLDGESRSISITGPLTHCNPAEQLPQKKFLSGLKQEPQSSFSCLVASKSVTNHFYVHLYDLNFFLFYIKIASRNFIL